MATKKKVKKEDTKVKLSASHYMLYVILGVYIIVAIAGLICLGVCIADKNYECGAQTFVSLVSYAGICGSSTIWAYVNKAAKENEIKLSNDKYRMRLELAKEIFKEYGTSLDDKSIDILQRLMSDKDINEIPPIADQTTNPVWQGNVGQGDFNPIDIRRSDNEEGLG